MQSEMGFPSSHQLMSYFASKSRLKLAARCPVSGCWPSCCMLVYLAIQYSACTYNVHSQLLGLNLRHGQSLRGKLVW